ncbi:MAG: hypothetical protein HC916_12305 [Coleofasciculaceae cyanobacterium SM2_1_6]|nr:hypothetical protein [Coleofasciculaceae cyanobacterium SM2_1_6]
MARSRPWSDANPDLRCQIPSPSIEEIEKLLLSSLMLSSLTLASFKPLKGQLGNYHQPLRDYLLTLPVMVVAIVLSLEKKQTRPPLWSKRQILDGMFYSPCHKS